VRVAELTPWLELADREPRQLPKGLGATPVTLLARELLRRGHELVIATLDLAVQREVVLEGPQLRICLQPFRDRHRGRDAYRVERRHLEATLRRERPDLVHAHWNYEYALAALRSGLPTLVTVHDWAPTILRWLPDPYRAARLTMFVRSLAAARHLTTVSPYLAARIRRWRRAPVPVVPNALEDEAFDDSPRTLRPDGQVLLAINDGFSPWKNVTRLLEAYRLLRGQAPASRLVLVGADHEAGGVAERWAAPRGLTAGVEFRGQVPYPEVRRLLARADVLVHPSLEESFGMVLLEAMAQGLPVVAGRRSGAVPWVLGQGRAGVLTDVTSPQAIAAAVAGLLSDGRRWASCSRAAHEHAWERFRIGRVVDDYLQVYARVRPAQPPSSTY
jgi:glycosyltransferase involved in cell wall biosynthesis